MQMFKCYLDVEFLLNFWGFYCILIEYRIRFGDFCKQVFSIALDFHYICTL